MIRIGTVIETKGDKALVYTMDSEFVYIRRQDTIIGEQVSFGKNELYRRYKTARIKDLRWMVPVAIVLAAVMIFAFYGAFNGGFSNIFRATETVAFIDIDINPSIGLQIDKTDVIIEAAALNDDAIAIVDKLKLIGMQLQDGIALIVTTAKSMGYVSSNQKIVLISGMINNKNRTVSRNKAAYAVKLKSLLAAIENDSDYADLLAVFVDDPMLRNNANKDNLSLGRELIYQYSNKINSGLSLDEIRNGSVNTMLVQLNGIIKGELNQDIFAQTIPGNTIAPLPTAHSPTDHPATATKTIIPLTSPPASTSVKTPLYVIVPTTPPVPPATSVPPVTPAPVIQFIPGLQGSVTGNTINLLWNPVYGVELTYGGVTYSGFQYYKIVASTSPHPKYPEDVFLAVISDAGTPYWSVNPSSGTYNRNPELASGGQYYFSVTYVFNSGMIYTDDVLLTMPLVATATPAPTPFIFASPVMNATVAGASINFTWNPVKNESVIYDGVTYTDFQYYKIVASTSPHPKYPENGYLTAVSDANTGQWILNPATDSYNHSPTLVSGRKYYFSVTYVFANGKIYANDIQIKVP